MQQRLVLAGTSRDAASALVSGGAFVVAGGAMLLAFPWISAHLVAWQDTGARYIAGGLRFIAETLAWAESNSALPPKRI